MRNIRRPRGQIFDKSDHGPPEVADTSRMFRAGSFAFRAAAASSVLIATVSLTLGGATRASALQNPPGDPNPTQPALNPPLKSACNGVNVAVLIDRSGSVGDWNYNVDPKVNPRSRREREARERAQQQVQDVRRAVIAFIDEVNKPELVNDVSLWMSPFASAPGLNDSYQRGSRPIPLFYGASEDSFARLSDPWFTTPMVDFAKTATNALPFADGTAQSVSGNTNGFWGAGWGNYPGGGTATNWQGALDSVPRNADLVIMVTDGDPTYYTGGTAPLSGMGGPGKPGDYNAAVNAANRLKQVGGWDIVPTRIVAIHAGQKNAGWQNRLRGISGPTEGVDWIGTDFPSLQRTLQGIAAQLECRGNPAISHTVSAPPGAFGIGQTAAYTYTARNTGDVALTDVRMTDPGTGFSANCGTLPPGGTCVRTWNHIVQNGDYGGGGLRKTTVSIAAGDWRGRTVTDTASTSLRLKARIIPT